MIIKKEIERDMIMSDIEIYLETEEGMIMSDIETHLEMLKREGIQYKNIFLNGKEHNNFKKYLDPEKSVTLNIFIGNEEFETTIQEEYFIKYIYEKYGEGINFSGYNGYFDGFENSNGDQLFLLAREDQYKPNLKGNDLRDSIRLTLAHEFMHVKQWSNSLLPLKKTTKWKFNILKLKPNCLADLLYAMNFKELAANMYAVKFARKQHFSSSRLFRKILDFIGSCIVVGIVVYILLYILL